MKNTLSINKATVNHMSRLESRRAKWAYVFILPWFLIFAVFYAYPLLYGIYVSFTDMGLAGGKWYGIGNYKKLFQDYAFWRSLKATFCYALIVIPLQTFIPLWAANVLRPHSQRMNNIAKLLIYLPSVICSVAQVIVWKFIFRPNIGIFAQLFQRYGLGSFSVFDDASTSIPIIALLIVFTNLGSSTVIYCAAIGAIPENYYEAAMLDGASKRAQFYNITVPMLSPTIIYVFITSTIGAMQIFVVPQMLTAGGPNYTSSTLLLMIYDAAFNNHHFGYAAAVGVVLFLITGILAVIQFRITRTDTIEY